MKINKPLVILASASPRRISLLKEWGIKFKVLPSNIIEHIKLKSPISIVKGLALKKAESVARKLDRGIVIGADTIVVLKGQVIGKPSTKLHSEEILSKLNGSIHKVYTGVAIVDAETSRRYVGYEISKVKMRKFDGREIKKLSGKHMDKAGAYAVQEKDDDFVEKIYGDYYNVVGLPYFLTKKLLGKFNVKIRKRN